MKLKSISFHFFVFINLFFWASAPLFSSDIQARLSSSDGSTAFQVTNSNNNRVGRVDSLGNMLMIGSGTVTSGFVVPTSSVGIRTETPSQMLEIDGSGAQIYLNSANSNLIDFGTTGVQDPVTNGVGEKLNIWGNATIPCCGGSYAIGVENNYVYFDTGHSGYKFYTSGGGATPVFAIGNSISGVSPIMSIGSVPPALIGLNIQGANPHLYMNSAHSNLIDLSTGNAQGPGTSSGKVDLNGNNGTEEIGVDNNFVYFLQAHNGYKWYDGNGNNIVELENSPALGVGVGGAPSATLQISSGIGSVGPILLVSTGTTNLFEVTASSISIGVGGNTIMPGGNFGIGTSAPSYALHLVNNNGATSGAHTLASLDQSGSANLLQLGYQADGTNATNALVRAPTALNIEVSNNKNLYLTNSGSVGIGTSSPGAKLHVSASAGSSSTPLLLVSTGTTHLFEVDSASITTAVDIYLNNTQYSNPDYVFDPQYPLASLDQLKSFIGNQHHLPHLPSTAEVQKKGIQVFEQNRLLLEKLEEAYLYILELREREKKIDLRLQALSSRIEEKRRGTLK